MPKHHTDPVLLTREAAWEAGVYVCEFVCVVADRVYRFETLPTSPEDAVGC